MNDNTKLVATIRDHASLVRPRFSPGLLLHDDDLTTAVSYTRNLSRLLFQTLFGCGVLCGLKVATPRMVCGKLQVAVARGIALNCVGDPVEVPEAQEIVIDTCGTPLPCRLWFAVRHIETCCVPRTAQCPPDEDEPPSTCTRERDGFKLQVFADRPQCACGCLKLGASPQPANRPAKGVKYDNTAKAGAEPVAKAAAAGNDPCVGVKPLPTEDSLARTPDPCLCSQRTGAESCNGAFYNGECACDCCDCDWIILAVAERDPNLPDGWKIDHSVRRFVRPVLMRDPVVEKERAAPGP